ncbi:dendritic cell-specific transmembrane [Pelobates cultripes]|uniref:Dendritic cell-specific transmembrane n=2 Tax=Pelobates cultripes TaxID=61616 RepID=A0AAD1W6V6_PELCU|nr:dendritic cell-specific transmembrane [Pelobates cultripes]
MALSHAMDTFVSGRKQEHAFSFIFLCLMLGLTVGAIFCLILHLSSVCSLPCTLMISVSIGVVMSVLAFLSRSMRCLGLLFVLSCIMKKGRNALIAAGTGIVLLNNVKNICKNLKNLAESLTCNLEAKQLFVNVFPLGIFVKIMHFIFKQSHDFFEILKFADSFKCNAKINSENIELAINETKAKIQNTSESIASLLDIASYAGHILILIIGISWVLLGSWLFVRKFLSHESKTFDNLYITKRFMLYDQCTRQQNEVCVLPLNNQEKKEYIIIPSLKMSKKQNKLLWLYFIPVFTNMFIWTFLMFLDFVFYWLIVTVSKHLQEIPPLEIPVRAYFSGKKKAFLVPETSSTATYEEHVQMYLFEPKCNPMPGLCLSDSWIPISIIIIVLFIFGTLSPFLIQTKMLVAGAFYPDKDLERIKYIHNEILRKRSKTTSDGERRSLGTIISQANFWFPILKMKYSELIDEEHNQNEIESKV